MTVRPQQSAKNKNIYICVFIYIYVGIWVDLILCKNIINKL